MRGDWKLRQRWIGGLALALAILLLIAAETVFKGWLSPVAVLAVYFLCTLLTILAVVIAVVDARAVARRTWAEQRRLLDDTLREIQKHRSGTGTGQPPQPSPPA